MNRHSSLLTAILLLVGLVVGFLGGWNFKDFRAAETTPTTTEVSQATEPTSQLLVSALAKNVASEVMVGVASPTANSIRGRQSAFTGLRNLVVPKAQAQGCTAMENQVRSDALRKTADQLFAFLGEDNSCHEWKGSLTVTARVLKNPQSGSYAVVVTITGKLNYRYLNARCTVVDVGPQDISSTKVYYYSSNGAAEGEGTSAPDWPATKCVTADRWEVSFGSVDPNKCPYCKKPSPITTPNT
jgi:hypothetical protein